LSPLDPSSADLSARLAAIVDASDDAIVGTTLDGQITSWNRAAEQIFGYAATEAIGRPITLTIPTERHAETANALSRIGRGETVEHRETVGQAKDGSSFNVSVTVSPIRDSDGRIAGAITIARPITERLRAEETRAQLAAIVESSDDVIVSKTLDGIITSWNRAAERMFGYAASEAVGQPITLIVPLERHAEEADVLARLQRGERIEHFETVRITKGGNRVNVSLTVSPVRNAAGKIIGASKIARDITERRRLEEERVALLAETQTANRAKDDFLTMFGHELRNPLAAIATAAHLLRVAITLDDVARPRTVIERQVGHIQRMIEDLLDAARVRAGKVALDRRPVNLAQAVEHALGVLSASGQPGRHVIDVMTEPVVVSADPARLEQVILNLLGNAVKYTPTEKSIRVTVHAEGPWAVLRVEDEGAGIPPDILPRIFEMFVQGNRSIDRAQGGLGIGLTLVRSLVELHGGTVEAISPGLDRGSVFTVRLPGVAMAISPEASLASVPPAGRRVLIVEDNDDAREMLRLLLEHQGHEVFEAADGAEAIRMASRVHPELAFIDLGLPLVDGYEVARHIRRQPDQPRRLIALTGYGQPEDRQRSLQAGFDEHVVKPVDPLRLAEIIDSAR
jgi:PAS domain S-box-containing protein